MDALIAFADVALAQYTVLYDEVVAEQGLTGVPSGEKLLSWMKTKLYEKSDEDFVQVCAIKPPREDSGVTAEQKEPSNSHVPEKEQKVVASVVQKTQGKLSSKMLKSKPLVYKTQNETGEEVEKSVDLPYLPCCVDYSGTCQALKVNGGLFTPCLTRPAKDSQFCKICAKQGFKYGKIENREGVPVSCYVDPSGKKEISYGTYLQKRDISRETVEKLIKDTYGDEVEIPEHYWNVDKAKGKRAVKKTKSVSASSDEVSSVENENAPAEKKRGRPKKEKSEDGSTEPTKPKGKRGRPKKVQKEVQEVVEDNGSSESWMNGMVEEEKSSEKVPEPEVEPVVATTNEDEVEEVEPVVATTNEDEVEELEPDEDEEEEGITYFSYNGKKYGYDEENTLFMVDEDGDVEIVGTWDPEAKKPVFSED
jgi:hypothetical protein